MVVAEVHTANGFFPVNPVPKAGSLLLVSDLHLNQIPTQKVDALAHVIKEEFKDAGEIFLLGDLADGLHTPKGRRGLESHAGSFFDALKWHHRRGTTPRYVPGNHDAHFRLADLDWGAMPVKNHGAESPVVVERFGRTLQLSHGDEHDPFEKTANGNTHQVLEKAPWVLDVLSVMYQAEHGFWKLLEPVGEAVKGVVPTLGEELCWRAEMARFAPSFFVGTLHKWEQAAQRVLEKGWADAVVMGHTHTPRLERKSGGVYLNTGDWQEHAVVSWADPTGFYQQDLASEPMARFLPFAES